MDEPRPLFILFIVVIVTIVFAFLYFSLPETFEAVDVGKRGVRKPRFLGKQVNQRPLIIGVWAAIAVPLSAWAVVTMVRGSRE